MLDGIPIADLAPPTLLGVTILLILFGRLVPYWFFKSKSDEAEKWRLAYEAQRARADISDRQTAELLEITKASHSVLVAMFGATTKEQQRFTGEGHVVPTPTGS